MKEENENQEIENAEVLESLQEDILENEELQEVEELEYEDEAELASEEELDEIEDYGNGDQEEVYERKKPLGKLVTLVAFTAIMFISSTYAWFSAQKNVILSNLEGTVNVAEGLEISLDAHSWSQEVNFEHYTDQSVLKKMYGETEHNIIPSEMLPVSTTGKSGASDTIGGTDLIMYRGQNVDEIKLSGIQATNKTITDPANNQYPGYYAIDFFLRNSSREEGQDVLQLNADSAVLLKAGGTYTNGLQNTVRVAFALYEPTTAVPAVTNDQQTILDATTGASSTIKDVAIWEPNASDHADYIVTNNNRISWKSTDKPAYIADQTDGKFTATEKVPTYVLMSTAVGQTYEDIYKWDGTVTGLQKQITLQTSKIEGTYRIAEGVQNLICVNSAETAIYPNNQLVQLQHLIYQKIK